MTETERHEYVNTMAEIILERPTATAKQLARELGFSQERSVYYWLRKAGFAGLTDFRTAVITGEYRVAVTASPGTVPLRARQVAELPLLASEATSDVPVDYVITTRSVSPDAFAVTVDSDDYRPLIERNDILLVDPDESPLDGDLALVRRGNEPPTLCRIYVLPKFWYVHPVTGQPLAKFIDGEPPDVQLLGRVIGLQRTF